MSETADEVFGALADPTRRTLLQSLVRDGPATATTLAQRLPVTRQAVVKHLATLERAGLLRSRRVGREVRYEAEPGALGSAAEWLAGVAQDWAARLARLATLAETTSRSGREPPQRQRDRRT